jgi:CIC family chloride channel protein
MGLRPAHYALIGMGAVVSGTTLAPITAILTIFELTYSYQVILPLMVACITSLMVVRLIHGYSAYETKLLQKGVDIVRGREVNILRDMIVLDYMSDDLQVLHTDTPYTEIVDSMEKSPFPHFVVFDSDERLAGVLTLRDLRTVLAHPDRCDPSVTAGAIMKPDVVTIGETADMETALRILARHNFSFLPVVSQHDPSKVVGQLKKSDVLLSYDQHVLKRVILRPSRWLLRMDSTGEGRKTS